MEENGRWNQVLIEIQQLRDDMREDVNNVHNKIDHKLEKMDEKFDAHRICVINKIDNQRKEREECFLNCSDAISIKLDTKWFKWISYVVFTFLILIGGTLIKNQTDITEAKSQINNHMERSKIQIEKLQENFNEKINDTQKMILKNGGKNVKETSKPTK